MDIIQGANRLAVRNCLPHAEFYLWADPQVRAVRLQQSGKFDRMESAGAAFFERVAQHYERVASQPQEYHGRRIIRVDANPDVDVVFDQGIRPTLDTLLAEIRK